jgi:D-arabinose 1-dehydrogenase-like Zn-dependent alcohol dehydrogenase
MRALVFGVPPEPFEVPDDANTLTHNLPHSPVGLRNVPDPQPLHDDWVITRPRLTGICGSDSKQILLDFGEGDTDNAMAAFCSFPQVMGHEVVADVVALGPTARADSRSGSVSFSTHGCRVVHAASNPVVRHAKPATTACAGASPTATSSRASTPGCRPM